MKRLTRIDPAEFWEVRGKKQYAACQRIGNQWEKAKEKLLLLPRHSEMELASNGSENYTIARILQKQTGRKVFGRELVIGHRTETDD